MDQKGADLGRDPVGRLLFSLALPAILAQVINVLYNVVDRMYIGHIPGTGPLALTGVGVTMPLIMAISAFASLVCMGGAPRAAIFMGRQDPETARNIMGSCFALLLLLSLILTAGTEWAAPFLLVNVGASEATLPYALDYIRIYAAGTVFVQTALGMNAFINTQGFARWGMATVAVGALLNICLDPVFIFVLGWGVQGAAVATVLSQAASAAFVVWFLGSQRSQLKLSPDRLRLNWELLGPCLLLGLSPFIMQITESLISVCFNASLYTYGGDLAVGAMTVLASVMQFSMLPLQGMTQGSQPIISYNFGARNYQRIRRTFRILLITCLSYSMLLWLLCELQPGIFAAMFTPDAQLYAEVCWALRVYMFGSGIFGIQIACQQTFIALSNAGTSLFLAVWRKIILLIPLIYILPLFLSDKVFAVFLAEPVADILAVLTTSVLFFRYYRKVLVQ